MEGRGINPQHHTAASLDLVKQINLGTVFRLLDKEEPISRIQLAKLSQLAPASITKIIRQFSEIGLIKEVATQVSTGGRRAVSLALNKHSLRALAIRLGRRNMTLGMYDLSAKLIKEHTIPISGLNQQAVESELVLHTEQFLTQCTCDQNNLIAISITLPGIITDVVHYMPHMKVNQWDIAARLKQHFKVNAFIGHDIRSLALAEHYFGVTASCKDSIFIRIHNGIGAGIIVDGKMFSGKKGHLGEIGHIQMEPSGIQCHCGHIGCLETILSNRTIEQEAQKRIEAGLNTSIPSNPDIHDVIKKALLGDELALDLINRAGYYLGKVIAQLVNLLNPEKIVLSGELTQAHSLLLPNIKKLIQSESLPNFNQSVELGISTLDHNSAIGSFAIIKQALLDGTLLMKLITDNE
ncbi:N-acetylglucosamine repressor [Thorsellia anophelis DSM 18579]|uniref:N-acetylglucosamine repressor n=2 Tax=Thorsellia anophelis TaxID=336804 RepID=A0A1H9Z9S5_9GAMM|nr:N-acetylglucosamine repressor [Thorsellia anophelis DSM 18579]